MQTLQSYGFHECNTPGCLKATHQAQADKDSEKADFSGTVCLQPHRLCLP